MRRSAAQSRVQVKEFLKQYGPTLEQRRAEKKYLDRTLKILYETLGFAFKVTNNFVGPSALNPYTVNDARLVYIRNHLAYLEYSVRDWLSGVETLIGSSNRITSSLPEQLARTRVSGCLR